MTIFKGVTLFHHPELCLGTTSDLLGGIAGKIARDIMAFSVHLVLGGSVFFF